MSSIIPLTSDGAQTFSIALDEVLYSFRVRFNTRLGLWFMDISLAEEPLVQGVALVVGIDLLYQYSLKIGGLVLRNEVDPLAEADSTNLGTDVLLYHFTEEEIA